MNTIWIFNQNSYLPEDGPHIRHYAFGKYLTREGARVFVFAGNVLHHSDKSIEIQEGLFEEKIRDGVHFIYVKTHEYHKNDLHRVINVASYYVNLFSVCKEIEKLYGKPTIIYASCMYPTALLAGIQLATKYKIPCISEARDLFPDEFITKGGLNKAGFLVWIARKFMKFLYSRSDALIFTMSGGKQYITDMKWDVKNGGAIDLDRVFYINNGVDLELFNRNSMDQILEDEDLDSDGFNVVYFGAIRFLNQMPLFIDVARELKKRKRMDIKILMWGTGNKIDEMRTKLLEEGLDNIVLKGYVNKNFIPSIAKRADMFIATGNSVAVDKYGASFNKLFDYLAAGKPILLPFSLSDSMISGNNAGYEMPNASYIEITDKIIEVADMDNESYLNICANAKKLSEEFDYKSLTLKLGNIIEECLK